MSWALLALSLLFAGYGIVLLVAPDVGMKAFGLPSNDASARFYMRAIAFRDLALALYVGLLTLYGTRRAVRIIALATLIIPAGDVFLLVATPDANTGRIPLHLGSAGCFAVIALWLRQGRH